MQFRYRARDKSGQLQRGSVDASDERNAADVLMRRGLVPLSINPAGGQGFSLLNSSFGESLKSAFQQKVSLDELIIFCRQMY